MTAGPERAVLDYALQKGYVSEAQVREALATQGRLRASGQDAGLLQLLGSRVPPGCLDELRAVYARANGPAPGPAPAPATFDEQETRIRGEELSSSAIGGQTKIPDVIGGYRLERELARGGMGAVYIAYHPGLDRRVALKLMLGNDPRRVKRFQIEARATARLRHPNIVAIHEVGEDQGFHFLVMDLIEGESLSAKLTRDGPFEPRRAAEIMELVARAVYEAHTEAILHRDLKPANILLDTAGRPLITDFGLAKVTDSDTQSLTKTGAAVGSPAYMAPEQTQGARDQIDRRTDVWALGATLYELLTDQLPFKGDNPIQLIYRILNDDPTPPIKVRREVPADLSTICLQCLEKRQHDRYTSALDLAEDLRRFLAGEPIAASPASLGRRIGRVLRRRVLASALVLVALVLLAVAGSLALRAQAAERAREAQRAEAEALASFELARQDAWPAEGVKDASEALQAAVDMDETLARSWRALARLALEAGEPERAAELLARAEAQGVLDAEGLYVKGCLTELAEDPSAAFELFEGAQRAGFSGAALELRLARTGAVVHAERGWSASAEELRWKALRLDASDPALLEAIVRARLEAGDVAGLAHLWIEVHDRLGEPGDASLQEILAIEGDALTASLLDPQAPLRVRVRAALASALFARTHQVDALRSVSEGASAPLLRYAARASLLRLGRMGLTAGFKPDSASQDLVAWAELAVATDDLAGACQALTLFEHAARLTSADRPVLETLAQAKAELLRASVPLVVALSATRTGGLSPADVQAVLSPLASDPAPLVAGRARLALLAMDVLRGAVESPELPQLELARQLTETPGLAEDLRRAEGYSRALDAALSAAPTADLHWLAARRAVRGADLKQAWQATSAALEASPQHLRARSLADQLRVLRGMPDETSPVADDADPELVRRAARRLAFARRAGLIALEEPSGGLRTVVSFRNKAVGDRRETEWDLSRAFDVDQLRAKVNPEGLETEDAGALTVRSLFAFAAWRSVTVLGQMGPRGSVAIEVGDGGLRDSQLGYRFRTFPHGHSILNVDSGRNANEWESARVQGRVDVTFGRASLQPIFDHVPLSHVSSLPARRRRGRGTLAVAVPGGFLGRLELVGRWTQTAPVRPPPPTPKVLAAFYASLVPLPNPASVPIVQRGKPLPGAPANLEELQQQGVALRAIGRWTHNRWDGHLIAAPSLVGDFEMRGWVPETGYPAHQFGFALRNSDRGGDRVLVGIEGASTIKHQMWMSTQRGFQTELHASGHYMSSKNHAVVSLARLGDYVVARYAYQPEGPWIDLRPPLYFPFDGEVDACLFARILDHRPPMGSEGAQGKFYRFKLRVPKTE